MKEKVQEFEIKGWFNFNSEMTIEAESQREAEKIARQHLLRLCKDLLSDKDNIHLEIKESHTISAEEREKLEQDHIIEPKVKKERKKRGPKAANKTVKPVDKPKRKYTKRVKA